MEIFITGGTGFIGRPLVRTLLEAGHAVTVLTRHFIATPPLERLRFVTGDPTVSGAWQEEVARHAAVVNLAGESISGRWTRARKASILASRLSSTRNLVAALAPGTLLQNGSAIGFYGARGEQELDERSPAGEGFLAEVAQAWEQAADRARDKGARVVIARFGLVLGKEGGALAPLVKLFRFFGGGPQGNGRQRMSWIHLADLTAALRFLLEREGAAGPFNLTAPTPVTNRDFMTALGQALGRPSWLRAPDLGLKLLLGEGASLLLTGQRVLPHRLQESGFTFKFPGLSEALGDLLSPSQEPA